MVAPCRKQMIVNLHIKHIDEYQIEGQTIPNSTIEIVPGCVSLDQAQSVMKINNNVLQVELMNGSYYTIEDENDTVWKMICIIINSRESQEYDKIIKNFGEEKET